MQDNKKDFKTKNTKTNIAEGTGSASSFVNARTESATVGMS
jgi:hypothetical protein